MFTIDSAVLRAVGVRYVLTDAEALDKPAILRGSVSVPGAPTVRLFELINPNLGTYIFRHVRAYARHGVLHNFASAEALTGELHCSLSENPDAHVAK